MDQKQKGSNKIRDIVRLHQLLKKWKKAALSSSKSESNQNNKSINFLKKTLSFSESTSTLSAPVPKGYFSVCVGEEMKRYVVPTECLSHVAFVELLREAEEEFGFQQEGILRIPCDITVFESVLRVVMKKKDGFASPSLVYCSTEANDSRTHHRQHKSLCR